MAKGKKWTFAGITLTETLRADGRYMATGRDLATGRPKPFYARTEGEAARRACESFGLPSDDSLGAFYISVYLPTVAHREYAWRYQIKWAWDEYLMDPLSRMRLQDITRDELQRHFNRLLAHPKLSVSSVKKIRIVLSAILNLAVTDRLIPSNPAKDVRLPKSAPPQKRALTFEQLGALIASSSGALQNAIVMMAYSLNLGEACAMTLGNIENGALRVDRQLVQEKGGARVKTILKHQNRYRSIPIPPAVEELLRRNAGSMYLVQSSDGPAILPNNLHRALDELLATLDGVPRVTPHELRHTFITLMEAELEAPHPVVCAIAGKANRSASRQYLHVSDRQMRKWTERFWAEIVSTGLTKSKFCQG